MEKYWLKKEGRSRLLVFVLGWAADHRVVEHIKPDDCDILCFYDFRTIREPDFFLLEEINKYSEKYLFAWSFGVWVAEQILASVAFDRAVALNGTPFPVDGRFGITPRRIDVTIAGIEKGGMEAFDRKAYGAFYDIFGEKLSPRPLDQNVGELRALRDNSSRAYIPRIRWAKAIVGEQDAIFPPENMINYWGSRAQRVSLPHYPFGDAQLITDEIDDR